ncbi:MAG: hypothetical protein M1820_006731 [Bogoriella megaspora]|nr:MAG: hypothetical protein M1820_006731 [Bogoriella megaspora]
MASFPSQGPDFNADDKKSAFDKEVEEQAIAEGHDADIPTNRGAVSSAEEHPAHAPNRKIDPPKSAVSKEIDTTTDIEKGATAYSSETEEAANGTADHAKVDGEPDDENIVWWDGDDDPANPMNWSTKRKWNNIFILSGITLVTPLASSIFAPAVPQVMADFHNSSTTLATFVVSVYLLGFTFGPLVIAPLSELYGRLPLYHVNNALFIVFTVACAVSSNLNMLIGFRFLAGLVGSTPLTIGGGTLADLMPQEKRGGAMALWGLGPLLGPIIGPVAGGYLAEAKGWRWVFWLLVMLSGVFDLLCLVYCRETYAPVLLQRKTERLRKETGNLRLRSKLDTGLTPGDLFMRSIIRPTKLLCFMPICTVLCLYTAVVYGILYLLFTTFTYVFEEQYHFSSGNVGLTYLGIGIGLLVGLGAFGFASDRILKAKTKNGGEMKPEYRLPPLVPGSFCIPLGLFLYGWTAQYHEQWAIPLLGTLFVGIGMLAVFMAIQTYLIDAFTLHAASAIAANTVLRSVLGACFPLFGLDMYAALGLGWGNSLLGFLSLAMCPIPFFLLKYGEKIRKHPKLQVKL